MSTPENDAISAAHEAIRRLNISDGDFTWHRSDAKPGFASCGTVNSAREFLQLIESDPDVHISSAIWRPEGAGSYTMINLPGDGCVVVHNPFASCAHEFDLRGRVADQRRMEISGRVRPVRTYNDADSEKDLVEKIIAHANWRPSNLGRR